MNPLDTLRQRFLEIRTATDVSDMFDFGADLLHASHGAADARRMFARAAVA
ncbi:hypothetical protein D3C78_1893490 [compost metagenome]